MLFRATLAGLLVATSVIGSASADQAGMVEASASEAQAGSALRRLFADSDEANLKRNPLSALYRGDLRYADQFGDYISDDYIAAERTAAESDLARLRSIDRATLSADDQVAYDVFKWQRTIDLRALQPDIVALIVTQPIDHFTGLHRQIPELSSGNGAAPFKTIADYENNLKRLDGFATYLDRVIGRFRQGMQAGITQPKLSVVPLIGQFDALLTQGVDDSPFYKPVLNFPAEIGAADQARLKAAYRDKLTTTLIPAYTRLRDFLKNEYLPAARPTIGLSALPRGDELYDLSFELLTTTRMSPDDVHQLGLADVARIRSEMEKVKAEVGFKGTLKDFFEHIRTDPQFKPKSKEELRARFRAVEAKLKTALPALFSTMPKAALEIKPVPDYLEKSASGGSYERGAPDGSRPGVFYFNGYDLPSRTIEGVETLYLHEGAPGHHFQLSLAQENEKLPAFQRFGGNTAFVEGWGLYAESLGKELGLFSDPYQYFGHLDDQMLRAMRLVVDTGIHAKGWTRDQAIKYMLDNSAMGKADVTAEVDRYIVWPAQATAYKIGQLKIRELRTKAEQALGPKFDVKAFHEQVLMTGALPLSVLEAKIDRWIAARRQQLAQAVKPTTGN